MSVFTPSMDSTDNWSQNPIEPLHTLLYVEDNPANMMLVESLIERRPEIRFLSACDSEQGIKIARDSIPDVILMDINLGGVDVGGFESMKILAQDPLTAHIPVIAVSSSAFPDDVEKGLDAGFFRYVTKPFKIKELMYILDMAFKYAKENGPNYR